MLAGSESTTTTSSASAKSAIAAKFGYIGEGVCQDAGRNWLTSWEQENETLQSCHDRCSAWKDCVTFDVMNEHTSKCTIRFSNMWSCLDAAGNTTTNGKKPWGCMFYATAYTDTYTGGTVVGNHIPGRSCFEKLEKRFRTDHLRCGACACNECTANYKWSVRGGTQYQAWKFWCGSWLDHKDSCPSENCACADPDGSTSTNALSALFATKVQTTTTTSVTMQQSNQGGLSESLIIVIIICSTFALIFVIVLVACSLLSKKRKEAWTPYGQQPRWVARVSRQFQQPASNMIARLRRSLGGKAKQHQMPSQTLPASPRTAPALPVAGVPGQELDCPMPPDCPSPSSMSPSAPKRPPAFTLPGNTGVSCVWQHASPRRADALRSPRASPRPSPMQTGGHCQVARPEQRSLQPSPRRSPRGPNQSNVADAVLADARTQRIIEERIIEDAETQRAAFVP
eukprot:TRINITY_DN94148_c0_g1_i1.p1 TRINITY_DN94148_c0_g1~~TRINITY_DN94148_c0_g1_i1.p1  ORF type:complete len:454 (+),score=28.01 TRINITY_DN94148_c0_g1_i1:89-1450(+)